MGLRTNPAGITGEPLAIFWNCFLEMCSESFIAISIIAQFAHFVHYFFEIFFWNTGELLNIIRFMVNYVVG